MSIEAMKQALEALENSVDLVVADAYNAEQLYGKYPSRQARVGGLKLLADTHQQAITSLHQAIAEAEKQEQPLPPVEIGVDVTVDGASVVAFYRRPDAVIEMFYSQFHPQPKREPLTDEQIDAEHDKLFPAPILKSYREKVRTFARAIHGIGKGEA
jgi:hypothetical protein